MLHEWRTYDLMPGRAMEYLELFRTFGVDRATRFLPLGGYWLTESGGLNRIHHLWIYSDFAERTRCRAAFAGDEGWTKTFVPAAFPLIVRQRNLFLASVRESPALAARIKSRLEPVPVQDRALPALAASVMVLSGGSGTPPVGDDDSIGLWRVLSGGKPGDWLMLERGSPETQATDPAANAAWAEVIRPLSLSPLA